MPAAPKNRYAEQRLEPIINPGQIQITHVRIAPGVTLARGTVLGELSGNSGVYQAYSPTNTDGSQVAKGILVYDISTNAAGRITYIAQEGPDGQERDNNETSVPMYQYGAFLTHELTGLTEGALTDMNGYLVQGSLSRGIIRIFNPET